MLYSVIFFIVYSLCLIITLYENRVMNHKKLHGSRKFPPKICQKTVILEFRILETYVYEGYVHGTVKSVFLEQGSVKTGRFGSCK